MSTTLSAPEGAIGRLVARYAALRGISKRRLAKLVDTDEQRIRQLCRGSRPDGSKTLGVIARGGSEPLLVSVARVLEIPTEEVALAIAADVGLPPAVRSRRSAAR